MSSNAQAQLADACCDMVASARNRAGRSADSDDIAQDACIRALQVDRPEAVRDPMRYVLRVARNLFIDRQRSRKRESAIFETLTDPDTVHSEGFDPERIVAGRQQLEIVLAALAKLPPRCREAFTLHRFHGLSYAAIARRMGVSTSMVEKHIAKAMLHLTEAARGEGS
jgi:RNA polymerase sigma-70 factor (ECF subfamily)